MRQSLIVLAKLDGFDLCAGVYGVVGMTQSVADETLTAGKTRGYKDAANIEAAVADKRLHVVDPDTAVHKLADKIAKSSPALSQSDCLSVAYARIHALPLLIQDRRARVAAEAIGVVTVSIITLPLLAFVKTAIQHKRCVDMTQRIGLAMRIESSVLKVLNSAADEIWRLRKITGKEK